MDIGVAVDRVRPGAKYARYDSYQALVDTWEDASPVPTMAELQTAWDAYLVEQQAELQRQQQLEEYRLNYGATPLNLGFFDAQTEAIRRLAQKIAWLEQEIADIR